MTSISIIIPVYKVERYVKECLASVVVQRGADIECIVVDDCSPDGSMNVVRDFVDHYHGEVRFKLLRHEKNRGLSAARNTGIEAATGDYLYFLDSDDYLTPDCISTMLEGLSLCPDAEVIQANIIDGRNHDKPLSPIKKVLMLRAKSKKQTISMLIFNDTFIVAVNRIMKRTWIVKHNFSFIEGIIHEDNPWSFQLINAASAVVVLPKTTYYYRNVETSITHTRSFDVLRMINSWNIILDSILAIKINAHGSMLLTVFSRMLEAKDMMTKQGGTSEERDALYALSRKISRKALCYGRPVLFLLSLTIHYPFYGIYSFRFVRHSYNKMEKVLKHLELMIDNWFC